VRKSRKAEGPRIGPFFLKPRAGIWQICWYDSAARQTRGVSTGTDDLQLAEIKLAEHALRKGKAEEREDVLLADALSFYWLERGQNLASWETQKLAMKYALEVWGNPMVSELTPLRQKEFVRYLRDKGVTDHTILRFLGCIWAAMNYYREEGRLKVVPPRISSEKWNPNLGKRDRVLSLPELGKLFNAASRLEHRWRYLILSVATGGRPSAIAELRRAQIDLDHNILHLNPKGRVQTKKRRPSLPMCPTLRIWAETWVAEAPSPDSPLIAWKGEGMTSDTYFDKVVEESGVENVCRYDIRHTVITWLVRKGVPIDEREIYIGHKLPGSATTEGYVHLDPKYLAKAAEAIEELFQALAPLVTARALLKEVPLEEQPVPESVASEVSEILKRLSVAGA
jgi:integrase